MRIAVCLVVAAVLAAGCMPAPKRHVKPTTAQRTAPATSARRAASPQTTSKSAPQQRPPAQQGVGPIPMSGAPPPTGPSIAAAPSAPPPSGAPPAPQANAPASTTSPAAGAWRGAPPGVANPDDAPELNPNVYRLMPGDGIHIDVFNEPELTVNAGIDATGSINYPLLGHIPAAGMTVREFEERITDALRGDYLVNPSVRVSIAHFRPIFITGNVRKVGSFPYAPGLTIEKALTMAGGITEYGSTKKIYIQHAGATEDQKEKVNLDTPIKPGDTILVEERLF
ncbi:MAG TPA: polysaccharide biosynthesis/export family protein [Nevskiaceae bacterium]|nr:polysaccharide biosynthesis/export family protein [Nevskiaceae bacterium]